MLERWYAYAKAVAAKILPGGAASKTGIWLAILISVPIGAAVALFAASRALRRRPAPVKEPEPVTAPKAVKNGTRRRIVDYMGLIGLSLLSAVVLSVSVWTQYVRYRPLTLNIATSNTRDEAYILMQAFKIVMERYHPSIRINLRQTKGTPENLQLLDRGAVQLAVAGSGVPASGNARSVVSLFDDAFQLLVPKGSAIAQFGDLKGKRVAVPTMEASEFQPFLSVAGHYGLKEGDFIFVGGDSDRADEAFGRGDADARFAVRPLVNAGVARLASNATFLAIDQSVRVQVPSCFPMTIPKGAYSANPAAPAADVPTVAASRVLLARADLDSRTVRSIAEVLIAHRNEIAAAFPAPYANLRTLATRLALPSATASTIAPIHMGAAAYADPRPPSFLAEHVDPILISIAVYVLVVLWVFELHRLEDRRRKELADKYNRKVLNLMQEARTATAADALVPIKNQLEAMMTAAVADLERNALSEPSFHSFRPMWQSAVDFVRKRKSAVEEGQASGPAGGAGSLVESQPSGWSIAEYLKENRTARSRQKLLSTRPTPAWGTAK